MIPRIDDGYVALYNMDGMIFFRPRLGDFDRIQSKGELTGPAKPANAPRNQHRILLKIAA